jgi:DNA topoisomerase-1
LQVAILCNHQRSVPKGHEGQVAKLQEKLGKLRTEHETLALELAAAKKSKDNTEGCGHGMTQLPVLH